MPHPEGIADQYFPKLALPETRQQAARQLQQIRDNLIQFELDHNRLYFINGRACGMVREQASELVADLGSWERYGRQLLEWGGLPEPRKTERSEPLSREQLQGAAELAQASLGQSPAGPWQEAALALLGKLDQQLLADLDPSNPALPLQLQAQYAELLESYTYLRTTLLRDEGADLDA